MVVVVPRWRINVYNIWCRGGVDKQNLKIGYKLGCSETRKRVSKDMSP
jgi:hypothetical protein